MSEASSALKGARADRRVIDIVETGLRGMITLRGDLASPALAGAVNAVAGVAVPAMSECAFDGGRGAVWMSPDELLLFVPYDEADAAVATLGQHLATEHHLALNVSDARCAIRLSDGPVADVLGKGVPIDLSDRAFPVNGARRTHLGTIAIGLWRCAGYWELVCFRSLAPHVFDWLVVSSAEGGEVGYH